MKNGEKTSKDQNKNRLSVSLKPVTKNKLPN